MTLPIHPQPESSGESISSWIGRLVSSNYTTSRSLLSVALGNRRWDRMDLDFLENQHLEVLGRLAAVKDVSILFQMSLYSKRNLLLPSNNADQKGWLASTYTTRYCSQCLKEDRVPYLRNIWRFHFVPICPVHKAVLQTGCSNENCRNSLPLVQFTSAACCPRCQCSLVDANTISPVSCNRVSQFSDDVDNILRTGNVPQHLGFYHSAKEFFDVLLFLVRYHKLFLPRASSWELQCQKLGLSPVTPYDWRKNNSVACIMMEQSLDILYDWPHNFRDFATRNLAQIKIVLREHENDTRRFLTDFLELDRVQHSYRTNARLKRQPASTLPMMQDDDIRSVTSEVQAMTNIGRFPYIKTVSRNTGINYRKLKREGPLHQIIILGQQRFRKLEEQKMKRAVELLSRRKLAVNESSVSTYLGKSFQYIRKSHYGVYNKIIGQKLLRSQLDPL